LVNKNNIIIKYQDVVPELSSEEYHSLKESIKNRGLRMPIIINKQNVLLDGHHRYKICEELGIEPKFEVIDFADEFEEQLFVIEANLQRRQLSNFQRVELELKMESIYKKRAIDRQLSTIYYSKERTKRVSTNVRVN
jgi:ParB-like chromosome segregation protein Spo0J